MPDPEFTKWLATLGVGGILAAFMFMYYRKDVKQYTTLWQSVAEQLMEVVKDNTASNTKLISMIEAQEKNQVRLSDIERFIDTKMRQHQ